MTMSDTAEDREHWRVLVSLTSMARSSMMTKTWH